MTSNFVINAAPNKRMQPTMWSGVRAAYAARTPAILAADPIRYVAISEIGRSSPNRHCRDRSNGQL